MLNFEISGDFAQEKLSAKKDLHTFLTLTSNNTYFKKEEEVQLTQLGNTVIQLI